MLLVREPDRVVLAIGLKGSLADPVPITVQIREAADIDPPQVHRRLAVHNPLRQDPSGAPARSARGLTPPGFAVPIRRVLGMTVVAFVFFVGVFAPLGLLGLEPATEIQIETPQLFQLHLIFVVALMNTPIESTAPCSTMTPSTTSDLAPMKQSSSMMTGFA